eukprot:XP_001696914.1 predicted protein [Chlamydomonas reinhardtii]
MASFFGDTLGAYMLPRAVLELLQQPGGHNQAGVCPDSGFAWLLSGSQLYIWRYREGKEARLRQQLLAPPAGVAARQPRVPLVSAFAASRLDLGSGPAFLAALSASDGSLHLVQVGSQGIFPKQLCHYRLLALTADSVDCWAISTGLRPSEALQWSFLNGLVALARLAAARLLGLRTWTLRLELLPEGGPGVCGGVCDVLEGYTEQHHHQHHHQQQPSQLDGGYGLLQGVFGGGGAASSTSRTCRALHLLDAVLSQAAAIAAAGGNLQPLVAGLERRLGALGALATTASQAATLGRYSTQLLDLLPKHTLIENSEKLAVVVALHRLQVLSPAEIFYARPSASLGVLVAVAVAAAVGRRDLLAGSPLHLAAHEVAARLGGPDWLSGADTRAALGKLAVAAVCEALAAADPAGQSGRLHTHMATLQPEEGAAGGAEAGQSQTLSGYVYGRLLADGRPADLLELPPQFRAGVTTFLQSQPPAAASDLLATHLLRTSAFADAAAVLHQSVSAAAAAGADKAGGKAQGHQVTNPSSFTPIPRSGSA